jgi:threonine synthase
MWKAFHELEELGLIGPERPRIICVQSCETAPIVRAFERGAEDTEAVKAGDTLAVGLNVPGGVGHFQVLKIIKQSEGAAVSVSEDDIARALVNAYVKKGWWISPEGAASLAALDELVERGLIRSGERVVAFNTGSFEKYLPVIRPLLPVTWQ